MVLCILLAGGRAAAAQADVVTYGELDQAQRIAFIEGLVSRGDLVAAQRFLSGSRFDEDDLGYAAAFLQAVVFHRRGRLAEAEKLLRQIVLERPAYSRVRLELVNVLAARGNREAAAYHLRLLADSAADPGSRQRFESFIDQLDPQRPFTVNGFVSIAPSTNVNNGSANDTIRLGGMPFAIDSDAQARSGLGVRAGLTGAFTHRLGENLTAYAAGSAVVSEYSGKSFDTVTGDVRFGLRRRTLDLMIGTELIADRRFIALEAVDYGFGGRLFLRKPLAPKLLLSGETQFIERAYDDDPGMRARTFTAEARLDYAYSAGRSVYGKVGVVDETVKTYRHNSFSGGYVEIGTFQTLPMGILSSFALKVGMHGYQRDFPGMDEPRRDRFAELRATFLKADLSWRGFTPRFGVSYYVQDSNVALYEYDRLAGDVTFTKEF